MSAALSGVGDWAFKRPASRPWAPSRSNRPTDDFSKGMTITGFRLDALLTINGDEGSLLVTNGNIAIGTTIGATGTLVVNGKAAIPLQVARGIVVEPGNRGLMRDVAGQRRVGGACTRQCLAAGYLATWCRGDAFPHAQLASSHGDWSSMEPHQSFRFRPRS